MLNRLWQAWRGSLTLRVVVGTLVLTIAVVGVVGVVLVNRITSGLLEAKERSSIAEASAGHTQAAAILAAANTGSAGATPERLVDAVIADLASRAGSPPLYEIVLVQVPGSAVVGPQRATNLVSTSSVPAELITEVNRTGAQGWAYTTVGYLDGRAIPGLAVAASVSVPTVGPYNLVYLFPYTEQQTAIALVRSATAVVGSLLAALVALIAWIMVRQVADPVREASRTAGRIAAGDLQQRVPIRGQDEMAQLAQSFNTMADSLSDQIERLENVSAVQQRFVSDVSHELRTPLTTIRMATDMLYDRRHVVDGDTGRAVELLATQVDRFESLLADLLEISRMDAGAVLPDLDEHDLSDLVRRTCGQFAELAEERRSRIRVDVRSDDTIAEIDARRVERILRNLLSNALEYGSGRPIEVTVDATPNAVAAAVRDHGPGVRAEDLHRIFTRFWRADPSRARTLGGTGLGLAISREDAQIQGGRLEVDSAPDEGSIFVLTLPRSRGAGLIPAPLPARIHTTVEAADNTVSPAVSP